MIYRILFLTIVFFSFSTVTSTSQTISIDEKTKQMDASRGFFDMYYDTGSGKIYLEIDQFEKEFLYVNSLSQGIGSNDIGLDRGQLGSERVVFFKRIGPKVLLIQPNQDYRASTNNKAEKRSIQEAFARSVLGGFTVEAESKGSVLIDITSFLMEDRHGVSQRLNQSGQGSFKVDKNRSALNLDRTKNFPKNSEFDVILTFSGSGAGQWLRSVTPSPDAVTVNQHHSFIELPDDNYQALPTDPRSGFFGISYQDYSTKIGTPLVKQYAARHRLEKKNPDAAVSEAVNPIVYYVDNGTPEPIRSALVEGALWWNDAFEAAGYKNAFKVEILPDDADPMDVRYNVIQWVHRSTRGWSYGASVTDPRTGEIIKGHVSLGSLRVRQDYMIFQGLLSPFDSVDALDENDPMLQAALGRLRQLSAHEVGHTLGIAHNFAASISDRASVMDYPHPLVTLTDNGFDLSNAYATGMGVWDYVSIKWGYGDHIVNEETNRKREAILAEAQKKGLKYITDRDARAAGGAHPTAHLWDNGSDASDELKRVMAIRKKALTHFDLSVIKTGEPVTLLHDHLVPIYLFHRYQIEAAVKLIGGVDYSYALKGDGQIVTQPVSAADQKRVLVSLLKTLSTDALKLPKQIIDLIPPRAPGYYNGRELFKGRTNPTFDPISAAQTAAEITVSLMLNRERAERLVQQKQIHSIDFSLKDLLDSLVEISWAKAKNDDYEGLIGRMTDAVILDSFMKLALDKRASNQVRAVVHGAISDIHYLLISREKENLNWQEKAHIGWGLRMIEQYLTAPETLDYSYPVEAPPGSPIGSSDLFLHCTF